MKKLLLNNLVLISVTLFFNGCYTQFGMLRDNYTDEQYERAESSEKDSTSESLTEEQKDTVIVRDRQTCYWSRNFLGEWELRCYNTYYTDYWYSYSDYPWWYYQSSYDPYFYDCHCPFHSYYHPNCPDCRYYCHRYRHYYYDYDGYHGHSSAGSGSTPSKVIQRPNLRQMVPVSSRIESSAASGNNAKEEVIGETQADEPDQKKETVQEKSEPVHKRPNVRMGVPLKRKKNKDQESNKETDNTTFQKKSDTDISVKEEKSTTEPFHQEKNKEEDSENEQEGRNKWPQRRRSPRVW